MIDLYLSGTNLAYKPFCPKPNHIKPCWCLGQALCLTEVDKRKCKRLVKGAAVHCWQHNPKETQ